MAGANRPVNAIAAVAASAGNWLTGVTGSGGAIRNYLIASLGPLLEYAPGWTGASTTRKLYKRLVDQGAHLLDWDGVDLTGNNDCTTQLQQFFSETGCYYKRLPTGTIQATKLTYNDPACFIEGEGRNATIIRLNTTTDHGLTIAASATGENGSLSAIKRVQFKKNGGVQAAHKHGIFLGSRCNLEEVFVNGFTNTGIYLSSYLDEVTDPSFVDHLPFFCYLLGTRSWNNGEDGMQVRLGANTQFIQNCQFNRNGRYGMYHHDGNDGTGGQGGSAGAPPTYGSYMVGGEASYNWGEGWRWESGTQINCHGMYAEGNGRDTPDGTAHINTPYDFYIGDSIDKSLFQLGSVKDTASVRVRVPNPPQYTTHILQGGQVLSPWWGAVADSTGTTASNTTTINALLAQLRAKGLMP